MKAFEEMRNRCRLDGLLGYLRWGEEVIPHPVLDPDAALEAFFSRIESLYPGMSRHEDRFYEAVMALAVNVEEAHFKAGFLSGFSLAQEIDRAAAENK